MAFMGEWFPMWHEADWREIAMSSNYTEDEFALLFRHIAEVAGKTAVTKTGKTYQLPTKRCSQATLLERFDGTRCWYVLA